MGCIEVLETRRQSPPIGEGVSLVSCGGGACTGTAPGCRLCWREQAVGCKVYRAGCRVRGEGTTCDIGDPGPAPPRYSPLEVEL